MDKPHLKFYGEFSGFNVFIVDGKYIRENINGEFTNFGYSHRFKFIPKNELWIDLEHGGTEEAPYYINSMLTIIRLLLQGKSYEEAVKKADALEKRERSKSALLKGKFNGRASKPELIKKIHKKLLTKYSKDVKIWIVNGELVRDLLFIDFTEGGHDLVYPFIPKNEIWIDDDVFPEELKFILLHEMHERNLMEKGWAYYPDDKREIISKKDSKSKIHKSAHRSAAMVESHCRHHPEEVEAFLEKEIV